MTERREDKTRRNAGENDGTAAAREENGTCMGRRNEEGTFRESESPRETYEMGRAMGERALAGQVYCLDGDLGTGKTIFAQGFAAGLGIAEPVNSPTFILVQQYEGGRLPFYHLDVYRIDNLEEMDEIGYEDYFYGEGVCLIEWAERIGEILPERTVRIRIEKDPGRGFDYRRILVEGLEVYEDIRN